MKRNGILLGALLGSLLSSAAFAASPFGSFGGIVGGGNSGAGLIPLHGWALDDNGVQAVDIMVDNVIVGRATYGRTRPGVTQQHPGFPDSAAPGWVYQLDSTRYLNGRHVVQPRILSTNGEVTLIKAKTFQFHNVTHNLIPFGKIEFPNPNAEMRGKCNLADGARRLYAVSGWALDSGVQTDDRGVGYVELLIDRAVFANTQNDCFYSAISGGLTQCYGLRRLDIEQQFPGLPDSPHAGWRFVLDIGALMQLGYGPGRHTLTVRSGDLFGTVVNIAEMPVTFICDEDLGNENSFGLIGFPQKGLVYGGTIEAQGWALDFEGIQRVDVLVDGSFVGSAVTGLLRPGVGMQYPGYPESPNPGWSLAIDTTQFSNGRHSLNVVVVDDTGATTLIGERDFEIRN